jgi:hypothetical protein
MVAQHSTAPYGTLQYNGSACTLNNHSMLIRHRAHWTYMHRKAASTDSYSEHNVVLL